MWHQEKCDLCGDCLVRCQYVDYDKETAVQQIEELMDGRPAEILKQCVTCCACNEYCPTGANPFDLINRLQEVHNALSIPEKTRKFMDAGATVPSALTRGDETKPALSLCAMEWALPDGAVGGQMFEGMTIAKGGEYFCYLGYVHIGMDSRLKANAQGFIDKLAAVGLPEIVFIHDDCYSMISKMPEYNVQVPFKPLHIVEYMRNYLKAHQDRITPLHRKIAYQRPCASRYTGEMDPILDEMFEFLGVERVARKYDRESALCCGSLFSRIDPERTRPFMTKNIQDASEAGGEAMVFLCPLCMGALAKPASEEGLKPVFITQLTRMALGELPAF
ncbi:MAG: heterodisulfide reductase-related iron-sulfur binding cluster [Desulfobacteraceae bacterium]|jgi:Fe-S oxidoreductase